MATNNFLPFCPTDSGTNLLSQAAYAVATDRDVGNQPGIASSKLVNKALRQATFITSQLAQFISDQTGQNVVDDANTAALLAQINLAFGTTASRVVTTTGSLANTDGLVLLSSAGGAYTFTIPAASTSNRNKIYRLQKTTADFNFITLSGGLSGFISTIGETLEIINDGTTWRILSRSGVSGVLVSTAVVGITTGYPGGTQPTKGTIFYDSAAWYRNGSKLQCYYNFWQTSAGTLGQAGQPYNWEAVPSGSNLVVDITNFLPGWGNGDIEFGQCGVAAADNNATWFKYHAIYTDNSFNGYGASGNKGIEFMRDGATCAGAGELGLANATVRYAAMWEVPITNW